MTTIKSSNTARRLAVRTTHERAAKLLYVTLQLSV